MYFCQLSLKKSNADNDDDYMISCTGLSQADRDHILFESLELADTISSSLYKSRY
jgi:hypothetical protein